MNANEITTWSMSVDEVKALIETNRQQQAEIEALKAENKFFKDLMSDVEILRKAQK